MSEVKVNKLSPRSGTTVTLGDSGDTITIPSGVTLANSGTIDNLNASNLTSGTVPDGRITGAYTGITNLTMSGDLTVDTNTLYVDSTNNRVGIGTSSPSKALEISGADNLTSTLRLKNTNPDPDNIWDFVPTYNTGDLRILDDGVERMRIDSSGHAIIPAGVTLGTSAGTYNASNTLDDYEEGTWTPTINISNNGFAGDPTPTSTSGKYTKIGRLVYCTGKITLIVTKIIIIFHILMVFLLLQIVAKQVEFIIHLVQMILMLLVLFVSDYLVIDAH
jgi:hypothetical protein